MLAARPDRICGLLFVVFFGPTALLQAQHPSAFTAQEKTAAFIQHLVKVAQVDPLKYQALVLEYEIGRALDELHEYEHADVAAGEGDGHANHEDHAGAEHKADGSCCAQPSLSLDAGDFIETALTELFPEYGRAKESLGRGDAKAAVRAAQELARASDPYVAAYGQLLLAESTYDLVSAGDQEHDYATVVELAQVVLEKHRLFVVQDYRACELIALAFEALERPLLEAAQYMILLTDYRDVPQRVSARVKQRLDELSGVVQKPLHTVANWMGEVERLLSDEVTGSDPTQVRETEILTALDKLIELQEARERNTCGNCGGGNCQGQCRGGKPGGNRSRSPARFSQLVQAEGRVLLHGVSRGHPGTVWGQLKAKDGARALQSYSGKLSPRYERLLKEYFKRLSDEEDVR